MPSNVPSILTGSSEASLRETIDSTAPESMIAETDFLPLTVVSRRGTSGRPMRIPTRTLLAPLK